MPNSITRVILFLSSYSPLFVMLAILNDKAPTWVRIGLTVIAVAAILGLKVFLGMASQLAPFRETIIAVSSRDGDAMSYIVTYLIPFLGISLSEPLTAVAMVILLAVVGIIYVNSNMIYTNPILNLFSYHTYEITSASGKQSMLLTKRAYVKHDEKINIVSLGNYVLLEKVKS